MVIDRRGFTLIELMIALGISGGLILVLTTVLSNTIADLNLANEGLANAQERMLAGKTLGRKLAMSNVLIYGLTKNTTPGDTHARGIIPIPSVCADWTTGPECAQSTLFRFLSLETINNQRAAAYCWSQPAQSLVVDQSIAPLLADPGGFENMIALVAPPILTTWEVIGVNSVAASTVSAECKAKLPKESDGSINYSKYRRLDVSAISWQGGASAIAPNQQIKFNQVFPQTISRLNIYSAGLIRPFAGSDSMSFKIFRCKNAAGVHDCAVGDTVAEFPNIKANYVIERFRQRFPAKPQTVEYQITGGSIAKIDSCVSPQCDILPLPDWNTTPFRLIGETFENLLADQFSFIKQDLLSNISFVLVGINGKVDYINVQMD